MGWERIAISTFLHLHSVQFCVGGEAGGVGGEATLLGEFVSIYFIENDRKCK